MTTFRLVFYEGVSRRATKDRRVPVQPVIGVSSYIGGGYHLAFFDFDKPFDETIVDSVLSMIGDYEGFIVTETAKGFHLIVLGHYTWRQVNRFWSRAKSWLDRKWVNLQRKMRRDVGAILRVHGKYHPKDLKLRVYCVPDTDEGLFRWAHNYAWWVSYAGPKGQD